MAKYNSFYCPFCQRDISPEFDESGDAIRTEGDGFVYVHDEVHHDDDYKFEELQ
jgi:sarcosine oxidase delta subunit